jgi:hypothetical protein
LPVRDPSGGPPSRRDEIGRAREVRPVAGLGGGGAKGDRKVALTHERRAQEQCVAGMIDEPQHEQLGDDCPVDRCRESNSNNG